MILFVDKDTTLFPSSSIRYRGWLYHYDMDAQIAVLANGTDTPEHAAELEQFAQVRSSCKAQVDELLARN